jgi:hypothetical protein
MSDCSLTHPIARDTCSGAPPDSRGLPSCASLGITSGRACSDGAPSCYLDRDCKDGHKAIADFLICAGEPPDRCYTRSSRRYKSDIDYLADGERRGVADQILALRPARFRYLEAAPGNTRLGIITEDAAGTDFVSTDGGTVDLYALLTGAITTIQLQDQRIRALEARLARQCPAP